MYVNFECQKCKIDILFGLFSISEKWSIGHNTSFVTSSRVLNFFPHFKPLFIYQVCYSNSIAWHIGSGQAGEYSLSKWGYFLCLCLGRARWRLLIHDERGKKRKLPRFTSAATYWGLQPWTYARLPIAEPSRDPHLSLNSQKEMLDSSKKMRVGEERS